MSGVGLNRFRLILLCLLLILSLKSIYFGMVRLKLSFCSVVGSMPPSLPNDAFLARLFSFVNVPRSLFILSTLSICIYGLLNVFVVNSISCKCGFFSNRWTDGSVFSPMCWTFKLDFFPDAFSVYSTFFLTSLTCFFSLTSTFFSILDRLLKALEYLASSISWRFRLS